MTDCQEEMPRTAGEDSQVGYTRAGQPRQNCQENRTVRHQIFKDILLKITTLLDFYYQKYGEKMYLYAAELALIDLKKFSIRAHFYKDFCRLVLFLPSQISLDINNIISDFI
jgi:hypothetical protein